MHSQTPAPVFSSSFDVLVQSDSSLQVFPNPRRGIYLAVGNLVGALITLTICLKSNGDHGIVGFLFSNLMGLMTPALLLCSIQSLVWLVYGLPTLSIQKDSLTLYLTGLQPISLEKCEIASVVLHRVSGAKFGVAFELAAPGVMRQRLSAFDRIYFELSQRLVGFGFSYMISLPASDDTRLLQGLKTMFGGRVVSHAPELEAMLSQA